MSIDGKNTQPETNPLSSGNEGKQNSKEALPDDGHDLWEWKSKYADTEEEKWSDTYSSKAWKHIKWEFSYLCVLFVVDLVLLGLWYFGYLSLFCTSFSCILVDLEIFRRLSCCVLMGFMGGIIYDTKILYKAVAHGSWHMDRVIWRIATPWVSVAITIVVICLMKNEVLHKSGYTAAVIGFFAGYYSESAITKLYDIAKIIF